MAGPTLTDEQAGLGGGGATVYTAQTKAQLDAISPAVGDVGIPTDGDLGEVWVCTVAGTWTKRYGSSTLYYEIDFTALTVTTLSTPTDTVDGISFTNVVPNSGGTIEIDGTGMYSSGGTPGTWQVDMDYSTVDAAVDFNTGIWLAVLYVDADSPLWYVYMGADVDNRVGSNRVSSSIVRAAARKGAVWSTNQDFNTGAITVRTLGLLYDNRNATVYYSTTADDTPDNLLPAANSAGSSTTDVAGTPGDAWVRVGADNQGVKFEKIRLYRMDSVNGFAG